MIFTAKPRHGVSLAKTHESIAASRFNAWHNRLLRANDLEALQFELYVRAQKANQ